MIERTARRAQAPSIVALVFLGAFVACKKDPPPAPPPATDVDSAAPVASTEPKVTDLSTCAGCQLAPTPTWSFEGVYSDAACTVPLAQTTVPSCAVSPGFGASALTYVDAVGQRKANEVAQVTLAEAPAGQRYRAVGKVCVRANEAAVDVTPPGCAGQKACRDIHGALTCAAASCRTFANGCPDFEETRLYATVDDPGLKIAGGNGTSGNMARLLACCNVLNSEASRLGLSPEAGLLRTAAAQCSALVKQTGPNGTAPEAGLIRTMLAGRNVPAACAGF